MGLVLLMVIWLITFVSTYFFIAKTWWLPTAASAAAAGIDQHFTTTFILMGIVFVAAQVIPRIFCMEVSRAPLFVARALLARQQYDGDCMDGAHGDPVCRLEPDEQLDLGVGAVPGGRGLALRRSKSPGCSSQWYFRYPGPGWQIWRDQAGIDRRVRGWRSCAGSRYYRPRFERRRSDRNHGGPGESRSGIDSCGHRTSSTAFSFPTCASSRTRCPAWRSICISRRLPLVTSRSPARSFAGSVITRCTAC